MISLAKTVSGILVWYPFSNLCSKSQGCLYN